MKQEEAAALYEIYERALAVLSEAEPVIQALPDDEERRSAFRSHGEVIVKVLSSLRAPLVREYPALDTSSPAEDEPDTLLDPEEQEVVNRLTPEQIQRIDAQLLADCAAGWWRKSARIVGTAWQVLSKELPDVPVGFYAQRVMALAEAGSLEAQGNLHYMRFSEVRLPRGAESP
ncbi:hypothetical protein PMI14_05351 [Acidovorax sp. CF316]|uniref:DUF3658 domain-containing protein n=1 Tax=Acidovorax sp. CF316 TaxID=1144317 RepID=UPI00026BD42F|nr:DUF3658 domain-containing protein [Acidovorax sp. CF316]EJE50065.1 hypothetical protein PMI14_05351 [Acidovorax sp. CF316]